MKRANRPRRAGLGALLAGLAACTAAPAEFAIETLEFERRCVLDELAPGELTLSNQGRGPIQVQARLSRTGVPVLGDLGEEGDLTLLLERDARVVLEHPAPGPTRVLVLHARGGSFRVLCDAP